MAADYTNLGLDASLFNVATPDNPDLPYFTAPQVETMFEDYSIPATKIANLPAAQLTGGQFSSDTPIVIMNNGKRAIVIGKKA